MISEVTESTFNVCHRSRVTLVTGHHRSCLIGKSRAKVYIHIKLANIFLAQAAAADDADAADLWPLITVSSSLLHYILHEVITIKLVNLSIEIR